jgi:hypothetical protein
MTSRLSLCLIISVLVGCGENTNQSNAEESVTSQEKVAASSWPSEALAKVGNVYIVQDELDDAVLRTVGEYGAMQLDQSGRDKILESLVMSKSMAQAQTKLMSEDDLVAVERQVTAFRDEILTKYYLRDNVQSSPVTDDMVKAYYDKHPEQFGAQITKHYQLIRGTNPKLVNRQTLDTLKQMKSEADWNQANLQVNLKAEKLEFLSGKAQKGLLSRDLSQIIDSLTEGQTSSVYYIDDLPTMIRITHIEASAAKPLKEVSNQIRKSLLPVQLKKSIKAAAKTLLEKTEVSYPPQTSS